MSEVDMARRTSIQAFFAGTDITSSLQRYLLSMTYTDNEEDETDDLQFKLQDRDGIWVEKWLNTALHAALETTSGSSGSSSTITGYKVTAKSGLAVRSRAGDQYYKYGTLAYGTVIKVKSISGGWANFTYSGKNAYCKASGLSAVYGGGSSGSSSSTSGTEKGLRIQAVIVRRNWKGDGKDDMLECGQFELDSVVAQGPPNTVTIKGTSLPYSSSIRQTAKSKSWEGYTLSGIVNEIASKNGMTCMFLSSVNPSYKRVEQYKTSDITFLQKLCHDAGCSLKVSNNILVVFDQSAYETKKEVLEIKRGSGYTKYKLSTGENNAYSSCCVKYTTSSGKVITATAKAEGDSGKKDSQCLNIYQKVSSVAEAKQLAEKMLRLYNKYELQAQFTFPGNPKLLAGCVVKLKGWGAWDGKYIIKQAKHKVDSSGYTTQITLRTALASKVSTSSSSSSGSTKTKKSTNKASTPSLPPVVKPSQSGGSHTSGLQSRYAWNRVAMRK